MPVTRRPRVLVLLVAVAVTIGWSLTSPGANVHAADPTLGIDDVSMDEGNAGTTVFTFTVSLSAPAGAGGVTFDIATADNTAQDDNPVAEDNDYVANSLTGQTIAQNSSTSTFTVDVNGDTSVESSETFFVNVTNVSGATPADGQGLGTIANDDFLITPIHDIQGNDSASPFAGSTVATTGIVTGRFQAANQLNGFFLQDPTADADPNTSEGIFVFCDTCPSVAAVGDSVRVQGLVSEVDGRTTISATTAGAIAVLSSGNPPPPAVSLGSSVFPITGDVDDFYEKYESMRLTYADTLTVADLSQLDRLGQITLVAGSRPRQFTEANAPSAAGNAAAADALAKRQVVLDDENNTVAWYLATSTPPGPADGMQFVLHPRANGGFSVGTHGTDFFRAGDVVNSLAGILDWSSPGEGTATWRLRPDPAAPAAFTVANPRPAAPTAVGGAITAASVPLGGYFTTLDTTTSSMSGPCGPAMTADCAGADSVAELNRQRERLSMVICDLGAGIVAMTGLENTATATIDDLLGAVNTLCGGAQPYASVNTGGTLGTDITRVALVYRTGVVAPVGSPLVDLDPIHSRPPTAQTFDVVDPANAAFGERLTVIANDFRSRECAGATGPNADAGDGQGCFNGTRTAQASRLLSWISGTVVPAAGDPDTLLLGTFNAFAQEDPITTLQTGGYTDLPAALQGSAAYSDIVDGQLGRLNGALASSSFAPAVTGVDEWHINADESSLFDYNDEVKDVGEAATEEKPDGSALVPPRVVFQPASRYRAADTDPLLVGLFAQADLSITKTDGVTSATPGGSVTYTITASNAGPSGVTGATVTDTFPASLTVTWTCVGAGGGTCTASGAGNINDTVNLPAGGSVTYTASASISAAATGTLSNTATVSAPGGVTDPDPANNNATDSDTLSSQADLSITKTDGVTTAMAGGSVTYTITASNAGPSNATGATVADTFPASLTVTWTCVGAGGGTCTASGAGNINDTVNLPAGGSVTYTASASISAAATGTLSNTATVSAPGGVTDPDPANNNATDSDTLQSALSADLSITKTDSPDPVAPGANLVYTITLTNGGPDAATSASMTDNVPANTTFVSLSAPGGWSCVTPVVGATGTITCTNPSMAVGSATFTLTVMVNPGVPDATVISNTAVADSSTPDPDSPDRTATATTTVHAPVVVLRPDLAISKTRSGPFVRGGFGTYLITVRNVGAGASSGTVKVLDVLLPGLSDPTVTAPGWTCHVILRVLSCTTSASLARGSSYPPISLRVRVGRLTLFVLNVARVSGGADVNTRNNQALNILFTSP